ncbi:hypothetical protein [Polyangium jinanense]|uniref:Uncharacterized protein n=1 Tax=Polyangium jinanense TaxID=2829994 RepID=A0A9X3XD10_9BACT|nr:hypothetical protein [Polyangium jinanense]MDC3959380.1 hypothetical protein [Polyangium jinanense]MDC3988404.1 hypothetical protein [Polyangium jinanense]
MARDGSSTTWVMQGTVIVSILAHASLIAAAGLRKERAPEELTPPADTWAGTTAAPIGGELHEVDVTGSEVGGAPGQPAPAPAPAAPPEPPAAAPSEPAEPPPPPPKVDPPKPKADPPKPKADPPKPKADPPKPKEPKTEPEEPVPPSDESIPPSDESIPPSGESIPPSDKRVPVSKNTLPRTKTTPPVSNNTSPGSGDKDPPGESSPGGGGSFGSAGASSVRDLGRAFTRALPMASGSDAAWGKLPVGSGGSIEVAMIISDEGKITGVEPLAPNPPAHLLKAAKNTMALLRGGTFALQGSSVTAGKQILRLSVELSDTEAPEDPSGAGAFGLAHRWEGKRGVASFTQTSGRHVEIKVEFLRVEL